MTMQLKTKKKRMCHQAVRHYKNKTWFIYRYLEAKKEKLGQFFYLNGSSQYKRHVLKSQDYSAKFRTVGNPPQCANMVRKSQSCYTQETLI